MPCNCCQVTDNTFGEADARAGLRQYRKHGPEEETRLMLDAIRSYGLKDASLLDVGGGVGVLHHELLQGSAASATHVDASSAYLKAAEEESARRGHNDRVKFVHADFVDVAADLPAADVVTLDRVVCCYPNFRALLSASAGHSRKLLVMAYPRETWYVRMVMWAINLLQALRRDPFRVFVHPVAEMDSVLRSNGLQRLSLKRLFVWEVAVYNRLSAA